MKRFPARLHILYLISITLMAVLFGCQVEDKESGNTKTPSQEHQQLIPESGITQVSISGTGEQKLTVLDEAEDIESFRMIISSAEKADGIVNMATPTYNVVVIHGNNEKQSFQLWLGGKGQVSSLAKIEDTHTIYTVPAEMTDQLIELMKR